ncbi:Similar to benzoyl-CoA reductase subunit B [hydrothermal vent metagenome]|uniref:Similar to benzoyl-CoA reductase subunit B n=1 Tax=hydrothermal vent metagenome TaxID=652676 RepID=A0A3B0T396_9ZZZZ
MTTLDITEDIVGRGTREGAALFRDWFTELDHTANTGGQSAYVFVMGSINEILKSFDLPVVFPEINSLQTAVRHVAHEYLDVAESYGYSPDICGYVKADVGTQLQGGQHPMAKIPPPSLTVLTNACNTYIKWAEIWERMYKTPVFTIDIPGTRQDGCQTWPGSSDFEADRKYIEVQLRELITVCEEVTGKKFDIDKFREVLTHANTMSRSWKRILELNNSKPSLFNALTDGTIFLGVANGFRGTEEGARYFERLVEEMEYKAAHGIGQTVEEKYRLLFVGVPCYPIFRRFNELFTDWGGTFVNSTYLWFASGGTNRGYEYDLADPIASLAEGTLISVRDAMDSMFHQNVALKDMAEEFDVDGIIYHPIKSCRTVSTGLADSRKHMTEELGIPSLFIESDMMDRRVVSEAQMKNRIDAFFEGLESRQKHAATGEKG